MEDNRGVKDCDPGVDAKRVTEQCESCGSPVDMVWNTDAQGYTAYCPVCGEKMHLCTECRKDLSAVAGIFGPFGIGCDWDDDDTCIQDRGVETSGEELNVDIDDNESKLDAAIAILSNHILKLEDNLRRIEEEKDKLEDSLDDKEICDPINRPRHYVIPGLEQESFDVILALVDHNCQSNREAVYYKDVLKYLFRYGKKNGVEDLRKARWYLDRMIEEVS